MSGVPGWIVFIHWMARLVLFLLVALSCWSVSIMIDRFRFFQALTIKSRFSDARSVVEKGSTAELDQWIQEHPSIYAEVLRTAFGVSSHSSKDAIDAIDAIDRRVRSTLLEQKKHLEKGLTVLATLGPNAPFIGLFGTVLGIIEAFGRLSTSQGGSQAVVGGISEALVATAVGLFVAIPAVIAYNYFSKCVKDIVIEAESLRDLYVAEILAGKTRS